MFGVDDRNGLPRHPRWKGSDMMFGGEMSEIVSLGHCQGCPLQPPWAWPWPMGGPHSTLAVSKVSL